MFLLAQCKEYCERFIRSSLPLITNVKNKLPTLPKFRAVPGRRPNSARFIEEEQPNWWQLPRELRQALVKSPEGKSFITNIQNTPPLSLAIGKWVKLPLSESNYQASDMAFVFLTTYLFATGGRQWRSSAFNHVWSDCVSFFDPGKKTLDYVLYAPIWGISGIARRLALEDGLEIRRLHFEEIARLASLDPAIAGVSVQHRLTLWPIHFFVVRLELDKKIGQHGPFPNLLKNPLSDWVPRINKEVAFLRSLLKSRLAVPQFAIVRDGYPRAAVLLNAKLPWQPHRFQLSADSISPRDISSYARRRTRFLALQNEPGCEAVAASMRRFAVAWENPFPADTLADMVAALEGLIVRDKQEVSYKLRIRTAHLLEKAVGNRQQVVKDLRDAYDYRSRVDHGEFVFDDITEYPTAMELKRARGKRGNPFHDVNEIHRLTNRVVTYYRLVLQFMIDHGNLEIDWSARGF